MQWSLMAHSAISYRAPTRFAMMQSSPEIGVRESLLQAEHSAAFRATGGAM